MACTDYPAMMELMVHRELMVNRVTTESLELSDRKAHLARPELEEVPVHLVVLDHRVLLVNKIGSYRIKFTMSVCFYKFPK